MLVVVITRNDGTPHMVFGPFDNYESAKYWTDTHAFTRYQILDLKEIK